jgi:quercetin dioxygenase-like cupin family protein
MASKLLQSPKLLTVGEGESFQFFNLTFTQKISEDSTNSGWVMNEISGSMGDGAPLHSHPWTETFYVLEGEVEVQVGNRKALATPGTLMHAPENVAHSFRACSPTVRMLEIIPASAEGFYREGGEKVPTVPFDPEAFQALCEKYNVRIFG